MKMVKSLLLVSAAGLVAVSGAQAADLPVKAKPVEYVKVCSLYGVGFYYIPGTDICMKIGAYFRAEYAFGNMADSLTNLDAIGADGQRTRVDRPGLPAARPCVRLPGYPSADRLRHPPGLPEHRLDAGQPRSGRHQRGCVYANRAFIQLAGFTWGLATSYYDFFSSPATSYSVPWSSDTGDGGWKVAAYTAQLGNGVSATLSFEEPRTPDRHQQRASWTLRPRLLPYPVGALPLARPAARSQCPDFVANLRVDQAWGSAQIMGAIHQRRRRLLRQHAACGTCAAGIAGTWATSATAIRATSGASPSAPASRSTSR